MSIISEIKDRILVLDGAMGTMIQRKGYYVENNEALNLSNPELISSIHREFIEAGADIITTNSFGANVITQARYGRENDADEMAFQSARIARGAADSCRRKVYVAGSVGPTGYSLSLPSDASNPAYRKIDFNTMHSGYLRQIKSLIDGGIDIILIETCFDALNAKAAILAVSQLQTTLPVIISASISDNSFRLLTGQTIEAFFYSVKHCPGLAAFGINCSLGSRAMSTLARETASFSTLPVIFYPNAGMPDEDGNYSESPEFFSNEIRILAEDGILNIAGGCCGTTPEHIRAVCGSLKGIKPHVPSVRGNGLAVSGLEPVFIDREHNFTNIGERTNVAGSNKFARLVAASDFAQAMKVAKDQVLGGATVIDVNMDDPMVDSREKMRDFLRYAASEPEVAKCAVMIDSSDWETVKEGLRNVQGKCIVNSISLRDGEEAFLARALEIKRYGAAMVVMAFDEDGQAVTYGRKIEICRRSYEILTSAGISPEDIIFDCNVLTIGTGIPEHAGFGKAFLDAVSYIKKNLPGALTSGGISNLSFAFRGNNTVREAMHSVFLYHAIESGLDMAIVNPQMLIVYDLIEPELKKCVEDVILDSDTGACDRLSAKAAGILDNAEGGAESFREKESAPQSPEKAVAGCLINGDTNGLEENLKLLMDTGLDPVSIVEGPLMKGMETVGQMFEAGRMFLPQVVRSAQVMHDAVDILKPFMEQKGSANKKPLFLIATVQGDVHDIGKNITSIVLQCSGFEVMDLGVMVPVADILEKAERYKADIIGVSGLITPSLAKMKDLCLEMSRRNMTTPLFVGGAATSELHTAVKLASCYEHVYYGSNASDTSVFAKKCLASYDEFRKEVSSGRNALIELFNKNRPEDNPETRNHPVNNPDFRCDTELKGVPYMEIEPSCLSNYLDWKLFDVACGNAGSHVKYKEQIYDILNSGDLKIKLCSVFYRASRKFESIVFTSDGKPVCIPMLRDCRTGNSLADYFDSESESPLGIFAVTVSDYGINDCNDIIRHAVKSILAEAGTEYVRQNAFTQLNGSEKAVLKLIAPGIGYPCCPDHGLKRDILALLPEELDIRLTDTCAMMPEHSTCGFLILHPEAEYRDIRCASREDIEKYASSRGYDERQKNLFLGFLEKQI